MLHHQTTPRKGLKPYQRPLFTGPPAAFRGPQSSGDTPEDRRERWKEGGAPSFAWVEGGPQRGAPLGCAEYFGGPHLCLSALGAPHSLP